jgi:hypothetical protein
MPTRKSKSAAAPPYSPKPQERAAIAKALRERKIAPAPRLKVEQNEVRIDHPDALIGHLLVQDALGSLDSAFGTGLLDQLARATSGGTQINETDLNFMFSFIKGIEPRDQIESTLAAQMSAVHMAMMRYIQHLPLTETIPQQDAAERAINKFARTFLAQVETLKRYRSGGEQNVTVHHVSVKEGGQAIVGNVTHSPRPAAPEKASTPPALTQSKSGPMEIISEAPQKAVPVRRRSDK